MNIWEISLWKLILAGGPIMAPIILCSVFALGIVIEKLIYFSSIKTDTIKLKNQVFEHVKNNKLKEAVELCEINPAPVARILKAGLLKSGASRDEIKEAIEDVSLFEIPNAPDKYTY